MHRNRVAASVRPSGPRLSNSIRHWPPVQKGPLAQAALDRLTSLQRGFVDQARGK
jgi:hypothetical protein